MCGYPYECNWHDRMILYRNLTEILYGSYFIFRINRSLLANVEGRKEEIVFGKCNFTEYNSPFCFCTVFVLFFSCIAAIWKEVPVNEISKMTTVL